MRTLRSGKSLPETPPVLRKGSISQTPNNVKAGKEGISRRGSIATSKLVVAEVPTSKRKLSVSKVEESNEKIQPVPIASASSTQDPLPVEKNETSEKDKRESEEPEESSLPPVIKEDSQKPSISSVVIDSEKTESEEKMEEALETEQALKEVEVSELPGENVAVPSNPSEDNRSSTKRMQRKKREPIVYETPATERLAKTEKCEVCGLGFTRKAALVKHSKIHEVDEPEPVHKATKSPKQPKQIKLSTPGIRTQIPRRRGRPAALSKSSINCSMCKMTFTRKAHLDRHLLLHSGVKPYKCDVCHLHFSRKDHMLAHRTKHGEVQPSIRCTVCETPFATMKALDEHVAQEHPAPPDVDPNSHICETCGRPFLQRRYLQAHRKLHMSTIQRRKYTMRRFPVSIQKHINFRKNAERSEKLAQPQPQAITKKEEAKPATTTTSAKTVVRSAPKNRKPMVLINRVVKLSADLALKSRKDSNTTDVEVTLEDAGNEDDDLEEMDYDYETMVKQYPVEEDFGDESSEDAYAESQEHPRHVECSVCGMTFADRSDLRKHYRVHKKKFICRFCGTQMASAGSLMRHNLTHTGRKAFGCNLCGRRFGRKDTLAVHLQAHEKSTTRKMSSSRPFPCRKCGASYTLKSNLIRHFRMCHSTNGKDNKIVRSKPQDIDKVPNQNQEAPGPSHSEKDMVISLNPFDLEGLPQRYEGVAGKERGNSLSVPAGVVKSEPMEYDEKDESNWESFGQEDYNEDLQMQDDTKLQHLEQTTNSCSRGFKFPLPADFGRYIAAHATNESSVGNTSEKSVQNIRLDQLPPMSVSQSQVRRVRPRLRGGINSEESRPFGCSTCGQRFNHRSNLSRHVRLIHNGANFLRKRMPDWDSGNLQAYLQKLVQKNPEGVQRKLNAQDQQEQHFNSPEADGGEESWRSWNGMNLPETLDESKDLQPSKEIEPQKSQGSSRIMSSESPFSESSFTFDPNSSTPYGCTTCGKAFQNKSNLWTHMRIHNKTFVCDLCGLKTATHGDLVLHRRTHTGERPYSCEHCDWKFSRKSALNKHIQKYHTPGATEIKRPWKYREDRESGNLKFKFVRSSTGKEGFQMQHLEHGTNPNQSTSSGMTISKVPSHSLQNQQQLLPAGTEIMPTTVPGKPVTGTNPILQSALQKYSGDSERPSSSMNSLNNAVGRSRNITSQNSPALLAALSTNPVKRSGPGRPPNSANIFLCRQCHKVITGKPNYIDHMKAHNMEAAKAASVVKPVVGPNDSKDMEHLKGKVMESQFNEQQNQAKDKPYTCNQCGNRFGQKAHLTRHMLSHQNAETAACNICGKICSSLGFLSRHYQYVHPDQFNPAEQARFRISEPDRIPFQKRKDTSSTAGIPEVVMSNDDEDYDDEDIGDPNVPPNTKPSYIYRKMAEEAKDKQVRLRQGVSSRNEMRRSGQRMNRELSINSLPFTITQLGGMDTSDALSPCERCGKEFTTKKSRSDHVWYCKREKSLRCPVEECGKVFKLKHDVVRHVKRHANDKRFSCNSCQSRFYHKQDLDQHLRSVHKVALFENPFPCDFCDREFMTEHSLNGHMKVAHGFDNSDILDDRVEAEDERSQGASPQNQAEEREVYGEEDYREGNQDGMPDPSCFLEQSMGESSEYFYCNLCNKSFRDQRNLIYHKQKYHPRDPKYTCNQCQETFVQSGDLRMHIMTYHNQSVPKIFKCRVCQKRFTNVQDRNAHLIKVHSSNISTNSAVSSNNPLSILKKTLVTTANTDMDELDYEYLDEDQQDSNAYMDPQNSEKGILTDEEGRFICNLCGKAFTEKKTLDAHIYYHTRDHKYPCQSCSAKFKQNSDLQRHNRIHHTGSENKSSIECPQCFRCFTDERYMRMHVRRYHSISDQPGGGSTESFSSTGGNVDGDTPNMSQDTGRISKTHKNNLQEWTSNLHPFIKQEPVDHDDGDFEGTSSNNVGIWNSSENLVDLTIEENQDLDEEEASHVIESWGGPSASEMDEAEQDTHTVEEVDYRNYRETKKSNDTQTTTASITKCAVTCASCDTDFQDTASIERHVCPNPINGEELTTAAAVRPNRNGSSSLSPMFECKVCSAKFSRSNELILHNRIHTGVKPFSCAECGQNFVQRIDLNSHMESVHKKSMEKYDCPFCPKSFFVRKSLDSHKRRNHGNIIHFFKCNSCRRQFTSAEGLAAHARICK